MEYLQDLQFGLIEYSYKQTNPSKNRIDVEYAKNHGIKKVDAAFAEKCNSKCLEQYKKIKEKVEPVSGGLLYFPSLTDLYYQEVFRGRDLKDVRGYVLSTIPYVFLIDNQIYAEVNWNKDYAPFGRRVTQRGEGFDYPLGPIVVANSELTAIWLSGLKEFIYLQSPNIFEPLSGTKVNVKLIREFSCNTDFYIADDAPLIDEKGKIHLKKNLGHLMPVSYLVSNDHIKIHFLDTSRTINDNVIDGNYFSQDLLLSWYGYDDYPVYKLMKKEVLGSNGKLRIFEYKTLADFNYEQYCVDPKRKAEMKKIVNKIKSGELKFRDLPNDLRLTSKIENIYFVK